MSQIFAYCRISTLDQTTENQRREIESAGFKIKPQQIIEEHISGSAFTQGKYLSPSGVLTTKPHDSAGAHRRACARIADSVCVMGFTAKVC